MKRRFHVFVVLLAALAVLVPGTAARPADAQQAVTLRIATLAPSGSSWMRVFNAWNNSLRQRTGNRLQLRFYPGGVAGDERDAIRKMRAGQMDGAAVTSLGLGQVVRPVLVLQLPGLFERYNQIDTVRTQLAGEFETQFETAGFKLLGWGDAGQARIFSHRPIVTPSDLRQTRIWAWRDDPIFNEFLHVIGANGVNLGVPEVYTGLQTNRIDAFPSSALAAVALQWFTRATHVTRQSDGVLVGATILKKERFDALPEDLRTALLETSRQAHEALMRTIRRDDDRAFQTITQHGVTAVDTSAHRAEWQRAGQQTRQRLSGRLYPAALLTRVEQIAGSAH